MTVGYSWVIGNQLGGMVVGLRLVVRYMECNVEPVVVVEADMVVAAIAGAGLVVVAIEDAVVVADDASFAGPVVVVGGCYFWVCHVCCTASVAWEHIYYASCP